MLYAFGGLGAIILALSIALFVQSTRLDASKNQYETLLASINVERKEAALEKEKAEIEQKVILGETNDRYTVTINKLNTDIKRLRGERARANSSIVPAASNSKSASVPIGQVCFDREELDRAQRDSEAEIEELIFEGSKAIAQLSCVSSWIGSLPTNNNELANQN